MYLGCDPDCKIGSYDYPTDAGMRRATGTVCPGIEKLLDELIVNAGDYSKPKSVVTMSFDKTTGRFCISNAQGMEIRLMNCDSQKWTVEAFSSMRTSTNYDDSQKRTVGGLNGVGAKLCVFLGKYFSITTRDPQSGLVFRQTWRDRMNDASKPHFHRAAYAKWVRKGGTRFPPDMLREPCFLTHWNLVSAITFRTRLRVLR